MTSNKLPDSIVKIDVLRLNYNHKKICTCPDRTFEVDYQNRLVYCKKCGAIIDPFEALCYIAEHYHRLEREEELLLQQAHELANYKPYLRVIKSLESQYRGRKMLPTCPNCHEPFYLEDLKFWINREIADARMKAKKVK